MVHGLGDMMAKQCVEVNVPPLFPPKKCVEFNVGMFTTSNLQPPPLLPSTSTHLNINAPNINAMDSTKEIEGILLRAGNYINGRDSDDPTLTYDSIMEWRESIGLACAQQQRNDTSRHEWYNTGFDYWEDESNCPATVDGVLGGFSCLSKKDLDGSMEFMRYMKSALRPELKFTAEENGGNPTRACECGAGKWVIVVVCLSSMWAISLSMFDPEVYAH
jgi:hypothetical protein